MKRLYLILILIFTISNWSFSETIFTDLENHWSRDYVMQLTEKGIISGYKTENGAYEFKPDESISVAEFVVLVMKSQNQIVEPAASGFWATPWIEKAYELGYIDESYINFEKNITREEMAEISYNAISMNEYMSRVDEKYLLDYIKDFSFVSDIRKDKVTSIYTMGIMSGTPEKKFEPQGSATRAEASVVVSRIIDKSMRKPITFDVPSFAYKSYEYDPITGTYSPVEGICFAPTDKNGIVQDEIVRAYNMVQEHLNNLYTAKLNDPNTTQEEIAELESKDWSELPYFKYDDQTSLGSYYDPLNQEFIIGVSKEEEVIEYGITKTELISYVNMAFDNFAFSGNTYPYQITFNTYDDFENWKIVTERDMMPYYELLFEDETQMVLNLAYDYMKKAPTDEYLQASKFNNYREKFTLKNGRLISFFINKDGVVINIGIDNK